jgi:hypothetical protein
MVTVLLTTLIFACKGPNGDTGPIGPNGQTGLPGTAGTNGTNGKDGANGLAGAAGATGAPGTNGKDGKDGVIVATATPWTKVNFDEGKVNYNYTNKNSSNVEYQTQFALILKDNTQPLLTKAVIDNGLILTYFKYNSLVYDQDNLSYKLSERVSGGAINSQGTNASSYFKIEGRAQDNFTDFANIQLYSYEYGVNYWNPQVSINTPTSQPTPNNYVSNSPELVGKSATFYKELFKKYMPEIRLVIVPLTTGGRRAAIDYSDYQAVKRAYNLKD